MMRKVPEKHFVNYGFVCRCCYGLFKGVAMVFSSPVVCLCDTPGVVRRPSSVSSLATKLLEI